MVHQQKPIMNGQQTTNSPTTSSFPCQYCRNTFTNRAQLERHLRIHFSSIDLKCNICDQKFESQDALGQHKLTHCKTFSEKIETAERSKDESTSAICVYCKQIVENEAQFKEHFKRHNNIGQTANPSQVKPNSFMCIVCRQTLSSTNDYNLHLRHHLRRSKQDNEESKEVAKEDESVTSSVNGTSLKCHICLVKFEAWQELVDHNAQVHSKSGDSVRINESEKRIFIKVEAPNSRSSTNFAINRPHFNRSDVVPSLSLRRHLAFPPPQRIYPLR